MVDGGGKKDANGVNRIRQIISNSALIDVFSVFLIFFVLWHFTGSIWSPEATAAEGGLYLMGGEGDIALLWERFGVIKSFGDFKDWIIRFVFHLSPIEFTEKPIFVVALAYFKFLYDAVHISNLPHYSVFSLLCLILSGWLVIRIFRLLSSPLLGYAIAVFFFQSLLILYNYIKGQHASLGIFIALLILYGYVLAHGLNKKAPPGFRHHFIMGAGISLLIFISPHLLPTATAFMLIIIWDAVHSHFHAKTMMLKHLGFLFLGFGLIFAYYGARDAAFLAGYMDSFRNPNLEAHLKSIGKDLPLVFNGYLRTGKEASAQNLPRDFSYIYYLLKNEGIVYIIFSATGVVFGITGIFSQHFGASKDKATEKKPIEKTHQRVFVVLILVFISNIFVLALTPLPYVSRAYLPAIVILLVLSGTGFLVFARRFVLSQAKLVVGVATVFFVSFQTYSHWNLLHDSMNVKPLPASSVIFDIKTINTAESITQYLISLSEKKDIKFVLLPPFADMFEHIDSINPFVYCYFLNLRRYGIVDVERYNSVVIMQRLRLFNNEHNYYRLMRKRYTGGSRIHSIVYVQLSNEFDMFSYYAFDLKSVADTVRNLSPAELDCGRQTWIDIGN